MSEDGRVETKTWRFDYAPMLRDLFALVMVWRGLDHSKVYRWADELMRSREKSAPAEQGKS